MKHIFLIVAFLLLAPSSSGLGLEGVIFDAEAAAGQQVSHEITVSLREDEAPMDLQAEVLDWVQSPDGSNGELDEGEAASCCSAKSFLRVSPDSFHLEPGESQKILVVGTIPEDVGSGGRYAIISVHSQLPGYVAENTEGMVGVAVAINALVRLTISGTDLVKTGEIENISIEGPSDFRRQNVSVLFKNTGNYHYKAQAESMLKDHEGNTLAAFTSPISSNIIPSASRIFRLPLEAKADLPSGNYSLVVIIKQEDGSIVATKSKEVAV